MAVPPLWMFLVAGAAFVVVATVGIVAYNEFQDRQRQKTKIPIKTQKKRKPKSPCTVCSANATVKFLPCGHMLMCRACLKEFWKEEISERCTEIMCRAPIEDIKYFSDLE